MTDDSSCESEFTTQADIAWCTAPGLATAEASDPQLDIKTSQNIDTSDTRGVTPSVTPFQYRDFVTNRWPTVAAKASEVAPLHMSIYEQVLKTGVPNYASARIPIPSGLNIPAWRAALKGYKDEAIVDFLEFGWPVNYSVAFLPTPSAKNHQSAIDYGNHVQDFLDTECRLGAMLGPFKAPPYKQWFQTSPLMTRPKKDSNKRRVIIDLSFPDGRGVNAGIPKNSYQGVQHNYTLPTISDLAALVAAAGRGAWVWKVDLERAYRQLRIDPLAYPLLGLSHNEQYFVDICPSFGCRVSGAAQQRVSEALCELSHNQGHQVLAYVDDFGGVQACKAHAEEAFETFNRNCQRVGLKVAAEKSASPSQKMEWLGFEVDTVALTITIPENKLREVIEEVTNWESKKVASKRELQSLAGKLAHISSCIRHARKFMSRILAQLRAIPNNQKHRLGTELKKDLAWFKNCAAALNCKQIIQLDWPIFSIECDACLTGGGGFSGTHCYTTLFPCAWRERYHISQIEALNALVAVKTLVPASLRNHVISIRTDNSASANVLVTGRTHDPILAACSRELAMLVVAQQLEIEVTHVPGIQLTLADALSRRSGNPAMTMKGDAIIRDRGLTWVDPSSCDDILTLDL